MSSLTVFRLLVCTGYWWCVTLEVYTHFHFLYPPSLNIPCCWWPSYISRPNTRYWRITWSIPPTPRPVKDPTHTESFLNSPADFFLSFFFHSPPTVDDDEMITTVAVFPSFSSQPLTCHGFVILRAGERATHIYFYNDMWMEVQSVGCCPLFPLYLNRHVIAVWISFSSPYHQNKWFMMAVDQSRRQ